MPNILIKYVSKKYDKFINKRNANKVSMVEKG